MLGVWSESTTSATTRPSAATRNAAFRATGAPSARLGNPSTRWNRSRGTARFTRSGGPGISG
jgi:hypothetical protein